MEWFREFAAKVEEVKNSPLDLTNIEKVELNRTIDIWMLSQLNQHIKEATEALDGFQTRKALQESLFLLKKDVDIRIISDLLDHKDLKTTMRYAEVFKANRIKALDKLDEVTLSD